MEAKRHRSWISVVFTVSKKVSKVYWHALFLNFSFSTIVEFSKVVRVWKFPVLEIRLICYFSDEI